MGAYFAMRIMKVADEKGLEAGRTYYSQAFAIQAYEKFQDDTNTILIVEGRQDLVVT